MKYATREKIYINGVLHFKCTMCGQTLPAAESFYIKGDGNYKSRCRKCESKERSKRYYERAGKRVDEKSGCGVLSTQNRANICIDCKNALGGCSWTAVDFTKKGHPIKFEPIPGWDAVPVKRYENGHAIKTYSIRSCPQFVPDEKRKIFRGEYDE